MKKLLIVSAAVAIGVSPLAAEDPLIIAGKAAFTQHCARCHGPEGKGDGMDANRLTVAPRDLTSGRFKWKTTMPGTPPSDADLKVGIIGHGLAGSGMPGFANLTDDAKDALVAYIKSISPAYKNAQAPQPIPAPANMKGKVDLKKGAEVYAKLQCALCHGEGGRANGQSAFSLVDAWQRPIKAANLTQGWTYRGGDKPLDIYHRMMAGIDGAPMPSYAEAVSAEEAWHMSAYVASLQIKANFSKDIFATRVAELPADAKDSAWDQARETTVNLQNYVYAGGKRQDLTVNAVSVKAVFNDGGVAFQLAWDDPEMNGGAPADAFIVALKPVDYKGDPRGNLMTLYENGDPALDFTSWSAAKPDVISRRVSPLVSAIRDNWTGHSAPAAASFEDGRWTMVFKREFAADAAALKDKTAVSRIGFGARDGRNGETGLKFSGSDWLWLHLGEKTAHH